jgi:hypothetical protein
MPFSYISHFNIMYNFKYLFFFRTVDLALILNLFLLKIYHLLNIVFIYKLNKKLKMCSLFLIFLYLTLVLDSLLFFYQNVRNILLNAFMVDFFSTQHKIYFKDIKCRKRKKVLKYISKFK